MIFVLIENVDCDESMSFIVLKGIAAPEKNCWRSLHEQYEYHDETSATDDPEWGSVPAYIKGDVWHTKQ